MGNRYGRKQRRQHLAKIETLQKAIMAGEKNMSMVAIVDNRVVLLDWKYALSENILREGMTDAEMIHIAEQVAVKFYERMKQVLANGR